MNPKSSGTQVPKSASDLDKASRHDIYLRKYKGPRHLMMSRPRVRRALYPKIRPLPWFTALAKRSCTSAQLTTFQNAVT